MPKVPMDIIRWRTVTESIHLKPSTKVITGREYNKRTMRGIFKA